MNLNYNTNNAGGCMYGIAMMLFVMIVSIVFCLVTSYFGMLLWNYAMTDLFGLPEITYWKTVALFVFVRLITPIRVNFQKN